MNAPSQQGEWRAQPCGLRVARSAPPQPNVQPMAHASSALPSTAFGYLFDLSGFTASGL
jgi:hypothetical protein